jgi:hypothetical protein
MHHTSNCNSSSHNCNNSSSCSCGNCNSTCDPCNQQPCGCAVELDVACVRYSGPQLSCIELNTGETLEQFLSKFNDKFCNISSGEDGVDGDSAYQIWLNLGNVGTEQDFIDSLGGGCVCPTNVFYTENVLGVGSTGTVASPVIIPSTTYTVPAGGAGKYRIMYTAEAHMDDAPGGPGSLTVKLLINNVPHPIFRSAYIDSAPLIDGIALNYQVTLSVGDTIRFQGVATEPEVHYISMATMIIDKLP